MSLFIFCYVYFWYYYIRVVLIKRHSFFSLLHVCRLVSSATHCNTLQHIATHCNTLQHTATHCNTLQYIATHCNTLQHPKNSFSFLFCVRADWCGYSLLLQHIATHYNTLQHTATHCNTQQKLSLFLLCVCRLLWLFSPSATHCNTLQHTATHDKTPKTLFFCSYACLQVVVTRGGGLGSRPKNMYGERLGDGVEYHLMKPTPRR